MEILKLTDICKDYQQGKEPVRVLKNINLTVHKGDYLAIMGPSGSGKNPRDRGAWWASVYGVAQSRT